MEETIYNLLQNISLEALYISLIVFLLTLILKYPIKKLTSKLVENKRKAVNTIIIFIPLLLSILLTYIYLLITLQIDNKQNFVIISITSFLYSLSIYAVYQRLIILIKGIKNNDIDTTKIIEELSLTSKELFSKLKLDENKLSQITNSLTLLINSNNKNNLSLNQIFENNIQIEKLSKEKKDIENEITEIKSFLKENH